MDDAVPPQLLPRLRDAARRVPALAAAAGANFRLLTPLDGDPVFAEYYASPELLGYVTGFLQRPLADLALAEVGGPCLREVDPCCSARHMLSAFCCWLSRTT